MVAAGLPRSGDDPVTQATGLSVARASGPDADFLVQVGQAVRQARERRGMARKVLSRAADVSERYLAQLEAGEGNASIVLLRRVATALGMDITDLLEGGERGTERRLVARLLDSLPPHRLEEALRRLMQDFGQDESVRRRRIALIGLRGAGKSTLGVELARELRRPFVELNREVEHETGLALAEVFLLYGQAGYRHIELRCLERVIRGQEDAVLSVGGGVVSEPETFRLLLSHCYTVWVKASPEEHMARVVAQGDLRPMQDHAQAMDDLKSILASREALYAQADATVDTSGSSIEASLEALRRAVATTPAV